MASVTAEGEGEGMFRQCPIWGAKACLGRRQKQEDTFRVQEDLLEVDFAGLSMEQGNSRDCSPVKPGGVELLRVVSRSWSGSFPIDFPERNAFGGQGGRERLSYYGVFDGHNGAYASNFCSAHLHTTLSAVHAEMCGSSESDHDDEYPLDLSTDRSDDAQRSSEDCNNNCLESWNAMDVRCVAERRGARRGLGRTLRRPKIPTISEVLSETFRRTDSQYSAYRCAARVGTTAVVALVGSQHICVAHCGDSRAVLYRNGEALALTKDHKADVVSERARIESAGGKVSMWNGARVMGVLAMSRAIGDLCLRPYGVIADPDVTCLKRQAGDEYLMLASDGLWDVLSSQEAYIVLQNAMLHASAQGASQKDCIQTAVNRLTRTAMDRGSRDNITVVIVDLNSHAPSVL